MASTLPNPTVKNNILQKRLLTTPAPPFLLLFLLLLLSLFLALFLLHIYNLLLLSLSHRPPVLHHFLSAFFFHTINDQGPLSSSTLVQHYLSVLLSPFSIFILANLIIFTLLFKTFYLSSSPSTSPQTPAALSDFSDFSSEKFDYGGSRLPEYVVSRHDDFFFSPPPHARYILASDPSEEYHILAFGSSEESTYFENMQSFNKLNNEWEEVQRVYMGSYIESRVGNGVLPQKEAKRQDKVQPLTEKVQANQEGRAAEKGGKLDGKTSRYLKGTAAAASNSSTLMQAPSQAVVINMEPSPAMASRRPRTSTPPSHSPPPATPEQPATVKVTTNPSPSPYQPTTRVTHPPPTPTPQQPTIRVTHLTPSSMSSMQRPPSSPKAKKSLHSTGVAIAPTSDQSRSTSGASIAKPLQILDNDKLQSIAKPTQVKRSTNQHQSNMIRSYSDQRLSQQLLRSPDVIASAGLMSSSSSSLTNRPHVQKAPRSRSAIDTLLTSSSLTATRPARMQRTQSLKASSSPAADDNTKAPSSPTFSEALDALSDADANKRFSNFIAHRFSLMQKELDAHPT